MRDIILLRGFSCDPSTGEASISRCKEIEYEEIRYEKPEVKIAKIEALENEIQKSLEDFKNTIEEYLSCFASPPFLLPGLHRTARPDRG